MDLALIHNLQVKMKQNSYGFTLIELLIVIAIIGILSAVGIPMYQGYMTTARINVAQEQHIRVRDFISSSFVKCGSSSNGIFLVYRQGSNNRETTKLFDCNLSTEEFVIHFTNHFWLEGWKNSYGRIVQINPPETQDKAIWGHSARPMIGMTYLYGKDDYVRIRTNIGEGNRNNIYRGKILEDFIIKE